MKMLVSTYIHIPEEFLIIVLVHQHTPVTLSYLPFRLLTSLWFHSLLFQVSWSRCYSLYSSSLQILGCQCDLTPHFFWWVWVISFSLFSLILLRTAVTSSKLNICQNWKLKSYIIFKDILGSILKFTGIYIKCCTPGNSYSILKNP